MKSTCGAVICQPGGDELKHDSIMCRIQVSSELCCVLIREVDTYRRLVELRDID